jgi:hypothetical protein
MLQQPSLRAVFIYSSTLRWSVFRFLSVICPAAHITKNYSALFNGVTDRSYEMWGRCVRVSQIGRFLQCVRFSDA